jgi:hypothetical protein
MSLALLKECALTTAAWIIWPTAYVSAEVESICSAVPPNFRRYAATNWLLPGRLAVGVQTSLVKIPVVFRRPTLLGKSTGFSGPLVMKRYFGLNLSWIIAFT